MRVEKAPFKIVAIVLSGSTRGGAFAVGVVTLFFSSFFFLCHVSDQLSVRTKRSKLSPPPTALSFGLMTLLRFF
jgi:hypothetical protein